MKRKKQVVLSVLALVLSLFACWSTLQKAHWSFGFEAEETGEVHILSGGKTAVIEEREEIARLCESFNVLEFRRRGMIDIPAEAYRLTFYSHEGERTHELSVGSENTVDRYQVRKGAVDIALLERLFEAHKTE